MFFCFCICILCLDFFIGNCIFSGQPFPAGFDLIFISCCARSKLSAVVEIKPLHMKCRNVLRILIQHFPGRAFGADLSLRWCPRSCAGLGVLWSRLWCLQNYVQPRLHLLQLYLYRDVLCDFKKKKRGEKKQQKNKFMYLTSKLPVQ